MPMLADSAEASSASTPTSTPTPPQWWSWPPARPRHHDGGGHPGWLPAAAGARRPARSAAGVGDREHWWLRRRADSVPARHHEQVVELDRPKRAARRHGAKSDPLDATRAAREALGRDQLAQPRATGPRAALSVRLAARRSAVQAAGDAQRQLHALVVAAPEVVRERLRTHSTRQLVAACARLRVHTDWDVETAATAATLRSLARRIRELTSEAADHRQAILVLVRAWRPDLLTRTGVGPIVAGTVLCAWSHAGRCRSDAAFAMLGGAAPIPASSGQTVRVRLNRSGDRQLNQALYTVVLTRLRIDPATRAYAQRRRAQGKTNREIKRCLIGYVARQLYRLLESQPALDAT
jgi:transposase